jgi:phage repressor protein C with HTH and peptisase S24 domain
MILDENNNVSAAEIEESLQQILHVPGFAQRDYEEKSEDESFQKNLKRFSLPDISKSKGVHRCFDIKCDSMEPTLYYGDKVVCHFVPKEEWSKNLKDNFVYAIIAQGDVHVKRISNHISENNSIRLYSDNKYYESIDVTVEDIKEIWYVNMKISPFMPSPNHQRNALHVDIDNMRETISEQSSVIKNLNSTIEKLLKQNRTR